MDNTMTSTCNDNNVRALASRNPDDLLIHTPPGGYPYHNPLPPPPSMWPQAPLMLRPTPNSNTEVRGIRYASSSEYLNISGFGAECALPINIGAEEPGKSFVVDFETAYFVGTLLMRIRHAPAAEPNHQMPSSYFDGKKRRFQAIIKGRFKQELSMSQCVTGQIFDRATGTLPAKWIVSSAIRLLSTLSPQLEATIDGMQPKFLAPLAATAHSVLQYPIVEEPPSRHGIDTASCPNEKERSRREPRSWYRGAKDLEHAVEEPPSDSEHSMLFDVFRATNACPKHSTTSSSTSKPHSSVTSQIGRAHV